MYTRCTHCDTVFRVTPQQLQASSGKVRCGRCHEVFDAFASLSAQPPAAAVPAFERSEAAPALVPRVPRDDADTPAPEWLHPAPSAVSHPPRDDAAAVAPDWLRPAPTRTPPVAAAEETVERPPPVQVETEAAASQPAPVSPPAEPEALTLPDELFVKGVAPRASWTWTAATLLLAVLGLGQAAWLFATPIAERLPALRPALEAFCAQAGCRLALPHLPDALFIEASDLQLLDAARPNEVLLTLTMRNRAGVAQAYPLLELTLTGAANQVTSRKVFRPQDYLEPGIDRGRGIGANQEVSIRLYLSTGELRAAGYRLYLFFA
jgi:predicted Zn finger-like uncharacterized protein